MSMILTIVKNDLDILRRPTEEIKFPLENKEKDFIFALVNTLKSDEHGVGLAAPQVGVSKRIFIVRQNLSSYRDVSHFLICINPTILKQWGKVTIQKEGCLSLPNLYVSVPRHKFVKMEYYGIDGEKHTNKFRGTEARILQHEYDHIEGRLIIDYAKEYKTNDK